MTAPSQHIPADDPTLAQSPVLRGALLTLDYIQANGPIDLHGRQGGQGQA